MISTFAFLLSLTTSIISAYYSYQRGIHDQIIEFNSATKGIQELTIKQAEILDKYKGTPHEQMAGLIGNQIHNTVTSASEVAMRLGTRASTSMLIPISQGLFGYGDYEKAEQIAKLASDSAHTVLDQVAALRWMARLSFQNNMKSKELATKNYQQGLSIIEKSASERNPEWVAWLRAGIYLDWAEILARYDCIEARGQFTRAVEILNTVGSNGDLEMLRDIVRRQFAVGIAGNQECRPTESMLSQ